jgi:peptide/nickel transport system ATP-binding protein
MVFQDPNASFDPRMTVGEAVAEPLLSQGVRDAGQRRRRVEALLERVGLTADDADRYPHELSGGQKQRAGLARALSVNPDLLVADEPVSALDVSVQAEILDLLDDLQAEFGLSILFITHDVGVVEALCDRVAVMYLGELVEVGPTEAVLDDPQHPYTRALVASIPDPNPGGDGREVTLTGDVPDPSDPPDGCRFHTRCPEVIRPGEYDLDPGAYRRVLDFRRRLDEDGVDRETLRQLAAAGDDGRVDDATLRATLRAEHDLPERLDDEAAETVLSDAVEAAVAGEADAAAERLTGAFGTVCERRTPALVETDAGHPAACLRHEAETAPGTPNN